MEKMTKKQQDLVDKNVRMMYSFIRTKTDSGVIPHYLEDDFISDMALRFCNSAMKFDDNLGFKFSTYAYGAFHMCYKDIKSRKNYLYEKNNFISHDIVLDFLERTSADTKYIGEGILKEMIDKANLSVKESIILQNYFFDSMSMAAIGRERGVTRECISQVIKRILKKLRNVACSEDLSMMDFYK